MYKLRPSVECWECGCVALRHPLVFHLHAVLQVSLMFDIQQKLRLPAASPNMNLQRCRGKSPKRKSIFKKSLILLKNHVCAIDYVCYFEFSLWFHSVVCMLGLQGGNLKGRGQLLRHWNCLLCSCIWSSAWGSLEGEVTGMCGPLLGPSWHSNPHFYGLWLAHNQMSY